MSSYTKVVVHADDGIWFLPSARYPRTNITGDRFNNNKSPNLVLEMYSITKKKKKNELHEGKIKLSSEDT